MHQLFIKGLVSAIKVHLSREIKDRTLHVCSRYIEIMKQDEAKR